MRFYFHLHNGVECEDEIGAEFPDEAAARGQAIKEARTMAAESVRQGHLNLAHYIEVADHTGMALFRIAFGEAVSVFSEPA